MSCTRLSLASLLFVLAACSGGATGSAGVGGNAICSGTSLIASEANNYAFSSTLTFPPVVVAPKTDLLFDWSGVTKDFLGHPLDPEKDLNTILFVSWRVAPSEILTKLNASALGATALIALPLQYFTDGGGTSARLLAFTHGGAPTAETILSYMDPVAYPPASHTNTLMVATGSEIGKGTRMIQAIQLDPDSTNTTVKMTSESTHLTYSANLHSLTPTFVPAGRAAITIDYGQLTKDALGNHWFAPGITTALVGHYAESPTELESKFLDLELIATELYRGEIFDATEAVLSNLKTSAGESFPGIDDTGTWLMALQCGDCRNRAPLYLTVLKVCTP